MSPIEAAIVSIGGVAVSVVTALVTLFKAMADRRAGIDTRQLDGTRLGLEALQASITVKDTLILQLKESLEESRQEVTNLKMRVEDLSAEIELLKEVSG